MQRRARRCPRPCSPEPESREGPQATPTGHFSQREILAAISAPAYLNGSLAWADRHRDRHHQRNGPWIIQRGRYLRVLAGVQVPCSCESQIFLVCSTNDDPSLTLEQATGPQSEGVALWQRAEAEVARVGFCWWRREQKCEVHRKVPSACFRL